MDAQGHVLYVEVKGTTGLADTITLTANEVAVARSQHPNTALFVVHQIRLVEDGGAEGGYLHELRPWLPEDERLEAKVYSYKLDV